MLEIRTMQLSDLEKVAAIEKEIFSMPWSRKGFEDSMKQEHTLFLTAIVDGEIAGYCGMLQSFDEAEITNVAVKEEMRRRGIGACMLRELFVQGAKRGITAYTLEVRISNQEARRLYGGLGFEEAGVRPRFYEHPVEDALIMWKR